MHAEHDAVVTDHSHPISLFMVVIFHAGHHFHISAFQHDRGELGGCVQHDHFHLPRVRSLSRHKQGQGGHDLHIEHVHQDDQAGMEVLAVWCGNPGHRCLWAHWKCSQSCGPLQKVSKTDHFS